MTQIDFYILSQGNQQQCCLLACRLAEKAFRLGHSIYIHTENTQQRQALEQNLWSFKPDAFLPHGDDDSICVGTGDSIGEHHDVLINLTQQTPTFFSRFERMAELVYQQASVLEASRERWKFYQQRGYPLQSHRL